MHRKILNENINLSAIQSIIFHDQLKNHNLSTYLYKKLERNKKWFDIRIYIDCNKQGDPTAIQFLHCPLILPWIVQRFHYKNTHNLYPFLQRFSTWKAYLEEKFLDLEKDNIRGQMQHNLQDLLQSSDIPKTVSHSEKVSTIWRMNYRYK